MQQSGSKYNIRYSQNVVTEQKQKKYWYPPQMWYVFIVRADRVEKIKAQQIRAANRQSTPDISWVTYNHINKHIKMQKHWDDILRDMFTETDQS